MFNSFQPRKAQDNSSDILTRLQDTVNAVGRLEQGLEITDFAGNGFSEEAVKLLKEISAKSITNQGLQNGRIAFLLTLNDTYRKQLQEDVFLVLDPEVKGQLRQGTGMVEGDNLEGIHGQHKDMQAEIEEADMKKRPDGNNNVHVHIEKKPWYSDEINTVVDRNGKPVKSSLIRIKMAFEYFKAAARKERRRLNRLK